MAASTQRPSTGQTDASTINVDEHVADEVYSLLDAVDSESIAEEFRIGLHNDTHDFENHVKVAVREGLDPSDSLAELADKTAVDESLPHMPKSRFSELTNDRDCRAVVRLLFALLHTPQLYHQRGVQRKRLEWLTRGVVAADATNLELTRSVVVSDEFVGDDEDVYAINTDDGGLKLHCAARVDGEHKHPLGATVTEGDTHESRDTGSLAPPHGSMTTVQGWSLPTILPQRLPERPHFLRGFINSERDSREVIMDVPGSKGTTSR